MSIVRISNDIVNVESYSFDSRLNCFVKRDIEFSYSNRDVASNISRVQGIKYGSKTNSAKWCGKVFWYATGIEGKKTYLKIGQKATYRIRTDNLSDKQDKKCEAYKSAVKKSKSYKIKGTAGLAAQGIATGVVVGLIIANAAFPPSTIITIVLAALGIFNEGVRIAVTNMVNSFEKWKDARDYYNTIKTYGKKL